MKPKANSILDGLPQNQRDQLEAWLFEENISYADASKRLLADFSVRCGPSSLSEWFQRQSQQRMLDRIAASRGTANLVVDKFKENPADMYQVLLDMAGQIAFDKALNGGKELDAETIFNFTKLVMAGKKQQLDEQKLQLDSRRVALLEKKAAAFDQAKALVNSGGLTKETLEKIERTLNLL